MRQESYSSALTVSHVMPEDERKEPFFEGPVTTKMPWMLGLFDVLGFSSRIARDGAEKVFETYRSLIERVLQKDALGCIGSMRFPGESLRVPTVFSVEVRYTYFSDTILLWLPLHPMFAGPFLQRCADLVCEALQMEIRLRGTIALGEGFMHKQSGTYLGSMVVEAARLEALKLDRRCVRAVGDLATLCRRGQPHPTYRV